MHSKTQLYANTFIRFFTTSTIFFIASFTAWPPHIASNPSALLTSNQHNLFTIRQINNNFAIFLVQQKMHSISDFERFTSSHKPSLPDIDASNQTLLHRRPQKMFCFTPYTCFYASGSLMNVEGFLEKTNVA